MEKCPVLTVGAYEKATLVGPPYSATMHEVRHGLSTPVRAYALFEQALRANRGLSVDEHMLEQAKLFSGFSKVASEDPGIVDCDGLWAGSDVCFWATLSVSAQVKLKFCVI